MLYISLGTYFFNYSLDNLKGILHNNSVWIIMQYLIVGQCLELLKKDMK